MLVSLRRWLRFEPVLAVEAEPVIEQEQMVDAEWEVDEDEDVTVTVAVAVDSSGDLEMNVLAEWARCR